MKGKVLCKTGGMEGGGEVKEAEVGREGLGGGEGGMSRVKEDGVSE